MLIDEVTGILLEAAEVAVLPRFRALAEGEVHEKSPGEVVTVADREAEELISRRLREVVDAPVVGEEATARDPRQVAALWEAPEAWLVDPLDGTSNFVAGRPEYAVMAALVRGGETVAAWIVRPAEDRVYVAERGSGAWRDGVRVRRGPAPADPAELRGAALTRFLDPPALARAEATAPRFAELGPGTGCAGVDYPRLLDGEQDFVLFQRTLPWDHAPGVLLLTEAGGVARRPDGSAYRAADPRPGLLNAADLACWNTVRPLLLHRNCRTAQAGSRKRADRTGSSEDGRGMPEGANAPRIRLEPWADAEAHLDLLRRNNTPEMTEHLGGPETEEAVLARHKRYAQVGEPGTGQMFRILLLPGLEAVGAIGYWERVWREETVYETGWGVLPEFQGRGIAVAAATAAVANARAEGKHRYIHAFPSVDHPASNAICQRAGFRLVGECDFEYPPGSVMRCNDWRLDLTAAP
ncbi:GNAT family N-acetyltransferase [Planotetraspora sp. A-T 1434]|uniref:inositol monophosphatase family protein n=1 Tax=Planotetraspora sp. A-T 1434 TaxID=2979219 RepID=UPI0021BF5002|nr:inositol monophosphatase family protein [Planotetraspora sp. A-T 1434]MCT9930117.1 GNAT family N-acetyltransferase [Planotetraspora sp. A-T 1434]